MGSLKNLQGLIFGAGETDSEIRDLLMRALQEELGSQFGFVESVIPDRQEVIYSVFGADKMDLFRRSFTLSDGSAELGDPSRS